MSPYRIAMFIHTLDDRAVARVVVSVSDHLTRAGADVAIVCGIKDPRGHTPVPESVTVVDLKLGQRPTAVGIPRLVSFIRKWRPDIVFAHGNGPNRAAVLARMLARRSIGLVLIEHNHYSSYVPPSGGAWRRRWLRDALTAVLYPRADRVAGVAPGVVADLERRFALPRAKLAVLPNPGPDPRQVAESAGATVAHSWFNDVPQPRIICSVGNLIPRKAQETLIESLPRIRDEAGDVRLVLIGRRDNERYAAHLERRALECGVADDVWFGGHQSNPLAFVAKSDAFALASINEGSPLVLVEAMACGVPVVATDSPGGSSFLLDAGSAGLLVPMRDPGAMAVAITRILLDEALRRDLVERGRSRAADFAPAKVAAEYGALARGVLEDRTRPIHAAG